MNKTTEGAARVGVGALVRDLDADQADEASFA